MDGILVVNKPQGMTSHDVVAFIRRRFGCKKVGHAGTLDPLATGVLVILLGSYTKRFSDFMSGDKEYVCVLTMGGTSDTDDAWGRITPVVETRNTKSGVGSRESEVNVLDSKLQAPNSQLRAAFEEALKSFRGDILQVPPAYAAIKHKGKKLYELARKGIKVEIAPRKVCIKELAVLDFCPPRASLKVVCSKGTYIRSLARDIGEKIGCGAYLSALERTKSGDFSISEAVSVEKLREMTGEELAKIILK